MTNCINCGAPLQGDQCPYCGTVYGKRAAYTDNIDLRANGTLTIGNRSFPVYVSSFETYPMPFPDCGRDMTGRLIRQKMLTKHKFTVIEV